MTFSRGPQEWLSGYRGPALCVVPKLNIWRVFYIRPDDLSMFVQLLVRD